MTRQVKDQMGRWVEVPLRPQRIISLVPSQTELLFDLGLDQSVIGITKFCVHPDKWYRTKTRVGGTKAVNIEEVRKLKPDLIIGNKEENQESDILALEKEFPVWMSDITDFSSAISMIQTVGKLTERQEIAENLSSSIQQKFQNLHLPAIQGKTVLYLIWNDPMMAVGRNTFINEMLQKAGFLNFMNETDRYPSIKPGYNKDKTQPDFIFLSSEPFPFQSKHVCEIQTKFPNSRIHLVDGEMFSWYGSRMLIAAEYFENLHEELLK